MIYKTPDNSLHDDMDGEALLLPSWPKNAVPITDEEAAQIRANNIASFVPDRVTMRQARLALLNAGLLSAVNSAISNMPGTQGEAARIEWDYSNEVMRSQPLTLALAASLGMTPQQMDALFVEAAKL